MLIANKATNKQLKQLININILSFILFYSYLFITFAPCLGQYHIDL